MHYFYVLIKCNDFQKLIYINDCYQINNYKLNNAFSLLQVMFDIYTIKSASKTQKNLI